MTQQFCSNCGNKLLDNGAENNFCNKCGKQLVIYNNSNLSNKNNLIAFLLLLFFGYLGLHRFYVGRTISALAILFLTPLSIIILIVNKGSVGIVIIYWLAIIIMLIVDFFKIILGKFKDKNDKTLWW